MAYKLNGRIKARPQVNDFTFGGHVDLLFLSKIFETRLEKGQKKRAGSKEKICGEKQNKQDFTQLRGK